MKKKALIIEDDDKNRTLEKDLLEMAGFEVVVATDGAGGILLAQKERPDVIVMDLRLPDLRGDLVAKSLRREATTSGIPILFVTASVVGDLIVGASAIPKAVLISKPIDTRTFAKQVIECIPGGLHG